MRIAYFSPLPPAESGIADYSAELLPHLAQRAEVVLFFDPQQPPAPALRERFETHPIPHFAARRDEFDVALYHMGNAASYHAAIWRVAREHPGVVVAHDTVFYHFFHELSDAQQDFAAFRRWIEETYGLLAAQRVTAHADDWTLNPVIFPLLEPVLQGVLGAVVHSHYAAQQVAQRCPELPVAVIPHHLSLPPPFDGDVDRDAIRRSLGLAERFVVGTFGFLTEWKRLPVALRAFARLRERHPEAVYCLVGELRLLRSLDELREEAGLPPEALRVTGRLPLEGFLRYMVATDVALNLRYPTAGETSGTLIRLLGLGVPTVVSDVGAFSEFPEDVVARVPVDGFEEEMLTAILLALADDERLRRAMGANARAYARTHHRLEASAQAYIDFIDRVLTGAVPAGGTVHPVAPTPVAQALADVAATLAEWGLTEDDDALLEPVARAMAALGIAPAQRP